MKTQFYAKQAPSNSREIKTALFTLVKLLVKKL